MSDGFIDRYLFSPQQNAKTPRNMDARQAESERGSKKYLKVTAGKALKLMMKRMGAGSIGLQVDSRALTPTIYKL